MAMRENMHVLIAEAYSPVADGLRAVLQQWAGCPCEVVGSRIDLTAALDRRVPDLLLMNMVLAGGADATCALASRHGTKIVALVPGFLPAEPPVRDGLTFLEMPFSPDELRQAVATVLMQ